LPSPIGPAVRLPLSCAISVLAGPRCGTDLEALRRVINRMSDSSEGLPADPLRLLEAISAATSDFLYAFDLKGRFLFANRRLLEVWGVSAEDAIGKSLYELGYPQWHADMHMRELRQVIETGQPIKGE